MSRLICWQLTGNADYLKDAHLIYCNALGHGQRANGGFGCDTCVGAEIPILRISVIEAHWCCTMRGGEGLARAIQYLAFQAPGAIYLPFFSDCELNLTGTAGPLNLKETTRYPFEGQVELQVLEGSVPQETSTSPFTSRRGRRIPGFPLTARRHLQKQSPALPHGQAL